MRVRSLSKDCLLRVRRGLLTPRLFRACRADQGQQLDRQQLPQARVLITREDGVASAMPGPARPAAIGGSLCPPSPMSAWMSLRMMLASASCSPMAPNLSRAGASPIPRRGRTAWRPRSKNWLTLIRKSYFLSFLFLTFSTYGQIAPFGDPFGATSGAVLEEFTTEDLAQQSLEDLAA